MDSNALLAIIKGEQEASRLGGLLDMIDKGTLQLVESVLVLGEVYKLSTASDHAVREREDGLLGQIRTLLESRQVELLDATPPAVKKATEFRLTYGLKLPDAVHLATAVLGKCDWFVTLDDDFGKVADLRVFLRADLLDPTVNLPWEVPVQDPLFASKQNVVSIRRPAARRAD